MHVPFLDLNLKIKFAFIKANVDNVSNNLEL
jgi:hypothetical protein